MVFFLSPLNKSWQKGPFENGRRRVVPIIISIHAFDWQIQEIVDFKHSIASITGLKTQWNKRNIFANHAGIHYVRSPGTHANTKQRRPRFPPTSTRSHSSKEGRKEMHFIHFIFSFREYFWKSARVCPPTPADAFTRSLFPKGSKKRGEGMRLVLDSLITNYSKLGTVTKISYMSRVFQSCLNTLSFKRYERNVFRGDTVGGKSAAE